MKPLSEYTEEKRKTIEEYKKLLDSPHVKNELYHFLEDSNIDFELDVTFEEDEGCIEKSYWFNIYYKGDILLKVSPNIFRYNFIDMLVDLYFGYKDYPYFQVVYPKKITKELIDEFGSLFKKYIKARDVRTEEWVEANADKVDWGKFNKNVNIQEFSFLFFEKFSCELDFNIILHNNLCKLGEKCSSDYCYEFIDIFKDKFNWQAISKNVELSITFINKFHDKLNWDIISTKEKLSENLIRKFKDKINWNSIDNENGSCSKNKLSDEFIREFKNELPKHYSQLKQKNTHLTKLQEESLYNWDGKSVITIFPNGSIGECSFKHYADMQHKAEEYDSAMKALDDMDVPRADEKGYEYSIVGRIFKK